MGHSSDEGSFQSWKPGFPRSTLDIEEVLSDTVDWSILDCVFLVAHVIKSFDSVGKLVYSGCVIMLDFGFKLAVGLEASLGVGMGAPLRVALSAWSSLWLCMYAWCRRLESLPSIKPQLFADDLKCSSV